MPLVDTCQSHVVCLRCRDAKVPDPPEGHKWKEVRHDNTVRTQGQLWVLFVVDVCCRCVGWRVIEHVLVVGELVGVSLMACLL